ncbi:MAG: hypothetical protein AB7F86_03705 [Bdellovibrionales bacterium]
MGKVKKQEIPMWAQMGHKKPTTRREFLGYGIIPFAAYLTMPSMLSLLVSPDANAADCSAAGAASMCSFITLNLAGGGSMSSNYLPRDAGGNPLPSYDRMGMGNNTGANALTFDTEFGVTGWATANGNALGQLLVGIRGTSTPEALANTAFFAVCVQSQDDTNSNRFDASGLVFKGGLVGSLIPNLGRRASATGLNQMASYINPPPPLIVGSFADLQGSIAYTRALQTSLSATQRTKLARLVSNLSASQARKLASVNSTAQVKNLVECAGIKNVELSSGAPIDPLANAAVATAWGINNGTAANNESRVFASMVYNGILGQAGSINLERGGYDYHNGTRTTGDQQDLAAGQVIGRILETAKILGKKVMVYVTSDGSVVSNTDAAPGAVWTSDRGSAGMAMVFAYDPAGRPATRGAQIGHYTAGQVADDRTLVGNSPELAAQAVFANWCSFNGNIGAFEKVVTNGTIRGPLVDEVLRIG